MEGRQTWRYIEEADSQDRQQSMLESHSLGLDTVTLQKIVYTATHGMHYIFIFIFISILFLFDLRLNLSQRPLLHTLR